MSKNENQRTVRILFVLSGNNRESGSGASPGFPASVSAGADAGSGYSAGSTTSDSAGVSASASAGADAGSGASAGVSAGADAGSGASAGSSTSASAGDSPRAAALPVKNPVHQAATLRELGHEVDLFFIRGRGLTGYLAAVPVIRRQIKDGRYDIIHSHYSLSAFAVSMAGMHRMVVSLAGSDVMGSSLLLPVTRFFCRFRWRKVIVKTDGMKARLRCGDISVIPNGVDMRLFAPAPKRVARELLGLPDKKIVLFAADPSREEKNFPLAQEAVRRMGRDDALLLPVYGVPHDRMPLYYNAADVLILTSLWEGSVNSVKEAMACNLPVVSTDVGDVRSNTTGLEGYYITAPDAAEMGERLNDAIDLKVPVNGRERMTELKLDSASVAQRLIEIYNSVNS